MFRNIGCKFQKYILKFFILNYVKKCLRNIKQELSIILEQKLYPLHFIENTFVEYFNV